MYFGHAAAWREILHFESDDLALLDLNSISMVRKNLHVVPLPTACTTI